MGKRVTVTKGDKTREFTLGESTRTGMRYHLPKGTDGYHFDTQANVVKFLKRQYPQSEVEIH